MSYPKSNCWTDVICAAKMVPTITRLQEHLDVHPNS